MPAASRLALRWTALALLWALVGTVVWLTAVQAFLFALNPFCQWQQPGIARVIVLSVDRNLDSQITDYVTVKEGERERVLSLSKAEAASLHVEDEAWILDAWYTDSLRPTQFRLTLLRILLEYPLLLLLPAAFGLWRVRLARQKADAEPPPPVRRTFTDDFHLRAQRFAQTKSDPAPGSQPPPMQPPVHPDHGA